METAPSLRGRRPLTALATQSSKLSVVSTVSDKGASLSPAGRRVVSPTNRSPLKSKHAALPVADLASNGSVDRISAVDVDTGAAPETSPLPVLEARLEKVIEASQGLQAQFAAVTLAACGDTFSHEQAVELLRATCLPYKDGGQSVHDHALQPDRHGGGDNTAVAHCGSMAATLPQAMSRCGHERVVLGGPSVLLGCGRGEHAKRHSTAAGMQMDIHTPHEAAIAKSESVEEEGRAVQGDVMIELQIGDSLHEQEHGDAAYEPRLGGPPATEGQEHQQAIELIDVSEVHPLSPGRVCGDGDDSFSYESVPEEIEVSSHDPAALAPSSLILYPHLGPDALAEALRSEGAALRATAVALGERARLAVEVELVQQRSAAPAEAAEGVEKAEGVPLSEGLRVEEEGLQAEPVSTSTSSSEAVDDAHQHSVHGRPGGFLFKLTSAGKGSPSLRRLLARSSAACSNNNSSSDSTAATHVPVTSGRLNPQFESLKSRLREAKTAAGILARDVHAEKEGARQRLDGVRRPEGRAMRLLLSPQPAEHKSRTDRGEVAGNEGVGSRRGSVDSITCAPARVRPVPLPGHIGYFTRPIPVPQLGALVPGLGSARSRSSSAGAGQGLADIPHTSSPAIADARDITIIARSPPDVEEDGEGGSGGEDAAGPRALRRASLHGEVTPMARAAARACRGMADQAQAQHAVKPPLYAAGSERSCSRRSSRGVSPSPSVPSMERDTAALTARDLLPLLNKYAEAVAGKQSVVQADVSAMVVQAAAAAAAAAVAAVTGMGGCVDSTAGGSLPISRHNSARPSRRNSCSVGSNMQGPDEQARVCVPASSSTCVSSATDVCTQTQVQAPVAIAARTPAITTEAAPLPSASVDVELDEAGSLARSLRELDVLLHRSPTVTHAGWAMRDVGKESASPYPQGPPPHVYVAATPIRAVVTSPTPGPAPSATLHSLPLGTALGAALHGSDDTEEDEEECLLGALMRGELHLAHTHSQVPHPHALIIGGGLLTPPPSNYSPVVLMPASPSAADLTWLHATADKYKTGHTKEEWEGEGGMLGALSPFTRHDETMADSASENVERECEQEGEGESPARRLWAQDGPKRVPALPLLGRGRGRPATASATVESRSVATRTHNLRSRRSTSGGRKPWLPAGATHHALGLSPVMVMEY